MLYLKLYLLISNTVKYEDKQSLEAIDYREYVSHHYHLIVHEKESEYPGYTE